MALMLLSRPRNKTRIPGVPKLNSKHRRRAAGPAAPGMVQPKLKIGEPNDKYEREAERVADQVMRMPEPQREEKAAIVGSGSPIRIQRVCRECEEELSSQPVSIQRMCAECEGELQRQPTEEEEEEETINATRNGVNHRQVRHSSETGNPGRNWIPGQARNDKRERTYGVLFTKMTGGTPQVTADMQAQINGLRGSGHPLPEPVRVFFEPRFGVDFSDVRVHVDAPAAQLARALNARAFTVGRDVVFRKEQYVPGTEKGQRLIAHELAHVVQQSGAYLAVLQNARGHRYGCDSRVWRSCCSPAQDAPLGGTLRMRRVPEGVAGDKDCPGHDPGEVARSRTDDVILTNPVSLRAPGFLLVADFGVGQSRVKKRVQRDPLLRNWLTSFSQDESYWLSFLGLDDCVGEPPVRERLRHRRAESVRGLLEPEALQRVEFTGAAPLDEYTISNASIGGRAMNRSVLISFRQELDEAGVDVTGEPPLRDPRWSHPQWRARGCDTHPNARYPAREVEQAHRRAAEMLWYASTMTWETDDARVRRLAARHFKVAPDATPDLWRDMTTALRSMLRAIDQATYECEHEQRGWRGCWERTAAVALHRIRLCPFWWIRHGGDLDHRAEVLLHEWAHKWGKGVARVRETYRHESDYRRLPAKKLVKTPDAYSGYIFELATGRRLN